MSENKVLILIKKANLTRDDSFCWLTPYCKVKYNNGQERSLTPGEGGIEPVFNNRCNIPLKSLEVDIEICSKGLCWDGVLGRVNIHSGQLKTEGGMPETKFNVKYDGEVVGTLIVATEYNSSGEEKPAEP